MEEDSNPHLWINELTLEQTRQHLADRELPLQGTGPARAFITIRTGSSARISDSRPYA